MSKKNKEGWSHMKKWTTDEGYTFLAKDKKDALDYLTKMPSHLGDAKALTEMVTD